MQRSAHRVTGVSEARDATRRDELTALQCVGQQTATVLAAADIDATDLREKRVAYTDLVDLGVNPGVAARIRRTHSLSWSFESSGADLERRSSQVRGLGAAERAWVAASSGDWSAAMGRGRSTSDASTTASTAPAWA